MPTRFHFLCLVAASLLLPSCAPAPANLSLQAIDKVSGQIIANISPLLYAKLDSGPVTRNRSVALVFTQAGHPPPNPTCAADLKAGLARQLRQLAGRAHIDLRLTSDVEEAAAVFVVGDTLEATQTQTPPVRTWLHAARQGTPVATSVFSRNDWFPGHFSADFLEGVFAEGNGRLIFGVSLLHWIATPGGVEGKGCAINFVERLAQLYSVALESAFREKYEDIAREARVRGGPSAYEVSSADDERFRLGVYFCAQLVDRTKLAACSSQIVRLIAENRR